MLYTIKQLKSLFAKIMFSEFAELSSNISNEINSAENIGKYIETNRESIKEFIREIGKKAKGGSDIIINIDDINALSISENDALDKIIKKLKLGDENLSDRIKSNNGQYTPYLISLINDFVAENNEVKKDSTDDRKDLKNGIIGTPISEEDLANVNAGIPQTNTVEQKDNIGELITNLDANFNPSIEATRTEKETNTKTDVNPDVNPDITTDEVVEVKIEGTFGVTQDLQKQRNNVNMQSFEKIISTLDATQLQSFVNQLTIASNKNNLKNGSYYFNILNYGEVKEIFNNIGYKSNGAFSPVEVASLFQLVENINTTQRKIPTLNWSQKRKILLDYNIDGTLDNNLKFYTREKEFLISIRDEKDFDNLLKNLGYTGTEDFNTRFSTNYYKAREEFKSKLAVVLDNNLNINPVDMLISSDAIKNKVAVYEALNENEKLQMVSGIDPELARKIKFDGAGIILGSLRGGAVSFDIKEATNDYIDSIQCGVINGTLGFGLNKNYINYKDGKFKYDLGLVNFIPYVSVSSKLYETRLNEFKDLFPKKIDTGSKFTIGAGISITGILGAGLDYSIINEERKDGIIKMKNNMSDTLDTLFKLIQEGKNFKETGINNTPENLDTFNNLKELYSSFGEAGLVFLKQGALNNYERELYENAEGAHLNGVSLGITRGLVYLIPIIGIHGEYNSVKWVETQKAGVPIVTQQAGAPVVTQQAGTSTMSETEIKETVMPDKYFEGIDIKNNELNEAVKDLDTTITFRTRSNEYSMEIMDPNNDLKTRWKGFEDFANRKGNYSDKLTKTIKSFKKVLDISNKNGIDENTKWYIISTVVQLMKKSSNAFEGKVNLNNINEKSKNNEKYYQSLINLKNERRSGYNNIFGFNTDDESNAYNEKLIEAGEKGSISEVNITGISFDASASLNVGTKYESIKGVDVFYSNIQIISDGNEPILIPITDNNKINAFIKTLEGLKSMNEKTKNDLIEGLKSGNIILNYYSDPDGFDDRIIPIVKGSVIQNESESKIEITGTDGDTTSKQNDTDRKTVSVGRPIKDTDKYGLFYAGEKIEKDNKPKSTPVSNSSSTPGYETGDDTAGGGVGGGNTGGR